MSVTSLNTSPPSDIILLVPGIRDFASRWQEVAKRVLELHPSTMTVGVRFGFYDVLSFAAPFDMSGGPYKKLLKAYSNAIEAHPHARISVVAHSFGTYLVGRLLMQNAAVKIHRLLLCGAVIREDYEWEEVVDRFLKEEAPLRDRILNECGTDDIWPILAKALSKRYGHAGRHGLDDNVYSRSVYYDGGHSLFFSEQHMRSTWKPYLAEGVVPEGNSQAPGATFFERSISLPFANLVFRLCIWIVWCVLFFWPATLTFVGYSLYQYAYPRPDIGHTVELSNFLGYIRENAGDPDEESWSAFCNRRLAPSQAKINFEGAIVRIDVSPGVENGIRTVYLAAPDCDSIRRDAKSLEVAFPDKALPLELDFSALSPSDGQYKLVRAVVVLDNILRDPQEKTFRVFARGVEFRLSERKPIRCSSE